MTEQTFSSYQYFMKFRFWQHICVNRNAVIRNGRYTPINNFTEYRKTAIAKYNFLNLFFAQTCFYTINFKYKFIFHPKNYKIICLNK